MRKIKACGFCIYRGNPIDSFLLMQHKKRLDLPKGHVDPGETELECALRELAEETGIQAGDIQLDESFRFTTTYPVWPKRFNREECEKTTVLFLGRLTNDVEIKITEHLGYEWRDWNPPHQIQPETIDPLLAMMEKHFGGAG